MQQPLKHKNLTCYRTIYCTTVLSKWPSQVDFFFFFLNCTYEKVEKAIKQPGNTNRMCRWGKGIRELEPHGADNKAAPFKKIHIDNQTDTFTALVTDKSKRKKLQNAILQKGNDCSEGVTLCTFWQHIMFVEMKTVLIMFRTTQYGNSKRADIKKCRPQPSFHIHGKSTWAKTSSYKEKQ